MAIPLVKCIHQPRKPRYFAEGRRGKIWRGVSGFLCAQYVVLLALVLSSACASAGDYTVAYAFDAGDLNDAGKKEDCEYKKYCLIESEKLNLSISLSFWHPDHKEVDIHLFGWPACCYFADGVGSVVRNARESLIRLYVFEGHARRRNEFIQNAPVGILYLQFSDMK